MSTEVANLSTVSAQHAGASPPLRPMFEAPTLGELTKDAKVSDLPLWDVAIEASIKTREVYELFAEQPSLPAVLIRDEFAGDSCLSRNRLMNILLRPFFGDVYGERPVTQLIERVGLAALRFTIC